jgi:hypothetical protein
MGRNDMDDDAPASDAVLVFDESARADRTEEPPSVWPLLSPVRRRAGGRSCGGVPSSGSDRPPAAAHTGVARAARDGRSAHGLAESGGTLVRRVSFMSHSAASRPQPNSTRHRREAAGRTRLAR